MLDPFENARLARKPSIGTENYLELQRIAIFENIPDISAQQWLPARQMHLLDSQGLALCEKFQDFRRSHLAFEGLPS
jgi:hypothetical protein